MRKGTEANRPFGASIKDIVHSFIYNTDSLAQFGTFKAVRSQQSILTERPIGPYVTVVGDFANDGIANIENQPPILEILESRGFLIDYMRGMGNEKNILSNIVQGEFWQKVLADYRRKYGPNCIVIPKAWGHDDMEPLNALESHAGEHSLGDVFIFLPGFPPHIVSELENISLVDLFHSKDRKEFGDSQIFKRLISDLNSLQRNGLDLVQCFGPPMFWTLHLKSIGKILNESLSRGGSLEQPEKKDIWDIIDTAFASRLKTAIVTNLDHLDIQTFMQDASKIFVE
ncbi:hypothetical protein QAD02_002867 [Eretmocerus hayati]|uniref:Uncharacterized protein n=1 Tax=Eretmocerus hayati TaxID=131215 RepID=A0ACC2NL32_9HYME|nr:hypothetical protein QAD02_002867 [Eretmocerus hayati]